MVSKITEKIFDLKKSFKRAIYSFIYMCGFIGKDPQQFYFEGFNEMRNC